MFLAASSRKGGKAGVSIVFDHPQRGSEWNTVNARKLRIPDSSDFIQLLPHDTFGASRHFQNLSRCMASGEVVWIAELPTASDDTYTSVEIEDGRLVAWSWSCYRVELNIESGTIENSIFTK